MSQTLGGAHDVEHLKERPKELLDKNMRYVPYSKINNATCQVSDKDKRLNETFYE